MVQLNEQEILNRLVNDEVNRAAAIAAFFNRTTRKFSPQEGLLIDYKLLVSSTDHLSVAELGRDILGFSNTSGGVLLLGVDRERNIVGHGPVDFRALRNVLGAYIGTRVDYDVEEIPLSSEGKQYRLVLIIVRRSQTVYPNLLRKDIELRSTLVRKLKYVRGTLFYRFGESTLSESPFGGDIELTARELGFSGAAPRTRTSFALQEDRPGLRLYAPINDRFFGREAEIAQLISKFEDFRGRGVSIAGFGGVGKTELAIRLAAELHRRGMFQHVYSGSAKQSLLGPAGSQPTDPVFTDLRTFLEDLSGWLGMNPPKLETNELKKACLSELAKLKKVLLLVDNLETISDRSLLKFLDEELPTNCWIIATSRLHKIRNIVSPTELQEMDAHDAAHLLRHELRRQGLQEFADLPIDVLRDKSKKMLCHPLAIRWFAWACKKDQSMWEAGLGTHELREVENFCVGHTIGALDRDSRKTLCAVLSAAAVAAADQECIRVTSGLSAANVERSLWELECAGLLQTATDEEGTTSYSITPMAQNPTAELMRISGWENELVLNLRNYTSQGQSGVPRSPLIRDLISMESHKVKFYSRDEKQELIARIDRALLGCPDAFVTKLKWLKAECYRHLDSPISADDLYKECADRVLSEGIVKSTEIDKIRILMEAATVARTRAQTEQQILRAIKYLRAVEHTAFAHLRVLGTLTEFYALLGDKANYERYLRFVNSYKDSSESIPDSQLDALEEALERAAGIIARKKREA